jgi:hypothetical protein
VESLQEAKIEEITAKDVFSSSKDDMQSLAERLQADVQKAIEQWQAMRAEDVEAQKALMDARTTVLFENVQKLE